MLTTAVRFAERTFGGTFGARFDTDEASGGGVVDVFCAPVAANKRSGKRVVSCRKAIQALKTQGAKLAAAVEAQLQLERQRQLERQQRAQQRETRRRPGEGH